jgi:hypothetical protein
MNQSQNSSISFFQLSLEEKKQILSNTPKLKNQSQLDTDFDIYSINDCYNSLERLRAFQLGDIFGKYKLF